MHEFDESPCKVLIGLAHGVEAPEHILTAYLMGLEALRARKHAVLWLTNEGINVAIDGFAETVEIPNAPDIGALHEEFVARGGRFLVSDVGARVRGEQRATWAEGAELAGPSAVYEYANGEVQVFSW